MRFPHPHHKTIHMDPEGNLPDLAAFEAEALAQYGMPKEIVLRHRLPHFSHLFSDDACVALSASVSLSLSLSTAFCPLVLFCFPSLHIKLCFALCLYY